MGNRSFHSLHSVLDLGRGLVAAVLVAAPAFAQCGLQWQAGMGLPGVNGTVFASEVWDRDGAGPLPPLLVLGGSFYEAGTLRTDHLVVHDPAGGTWASLGVVNGPVSALAVAANGDLIVGGAFTQVGGVAANRVARFDGTNWSALGGGAGQGSVAALAVMQNGDIVAGGDFTTIGGIAANRIARWNGVSWTAMGSGVGGPSPIVRALAVLPNGDLVAGGPFSSAGGIAAPCVARWSGSAWSAMCTSITNVNGPAALSLLTLPNGDLLVAGAFTSINGVASNNIARWSNGTWSPLGAGSAGGIGSLARLPNGDIAAGGRFLLGGVHYLARWDGSSWSPFGDSPNQIVHSLTVMPNGDMVAAGLFTAIGSVPALGVALWNGTSWSPPSSGAGALGGGDRDVLAAVTMPNGDLVVAGEFTTIGGIAAQRVARWDGSTWSPIGSGLPLAVHSLAVLPGGDLVASGNAGVQRWDGSNWIALLTAGNHRTMAVLANGDLIVARTSGPSMLQRWDGTSWSPMAVGGVLVDAIVQMPNGDVVIGGWFVSVDGVPAPYIARWNGATWSSLGGGMNGRVTALAVMPDGSLVAAGVFNLAGGVPVNGIARWNGATWSALGAGLPAPGGPSLLPLPNGDLLVSSASPVGSGWATRLDRWNGSAWSSIGPGCDELVRGLLARPNGDIIAHGSFLNAGGVPSARVARLSPTCPASAVSYGAGCAGSGGLNVLTPTSLPWLGSTFRATATGMPAQALVLSVYGFTPVSLPMSAALPQGLPGCSVQMLPDLLEVMLPVAGTVQTQLAVPATATLVGLVFHHYVVPLEVDSALQVLAVTSSNALTLVVGSL
jgi:hypothetical protein